MSQIRRGQANGIAALIVMHVDFRLLNKLNVASHRRRSFRQHG
jgi:hypothetical protein